MFLNPKNVKTGSVRVVNPLNWANDTKRSLRNVAKTGVAALTSSEDGSSMHIVPMVSTHDNALFKKISEWVVHWLCSPQYEKYFEKKSTVRSLLAVWCLHLFTDEIYTEPFKFFMQQDMDEMVLDVTMALKALGMDKKIDEPNERLEAALQNLEATVKQAADSAFTESQKEFTTKLKSMVVKVVATLETKKDPMEQDPADDKTVRTLPMTCAMVGRGLAMYCASGEINTDYRSYLDLTPEGGELDTTKQVQQLADLNCWTKEDAQRVFMQFNLMMDSAASEGSMSPTPEQMTLEEVYRLIKIKKIRYVSGEEFTQRMMNFEKTTPADFGARACEQLGGGAFQLHVVEVFDRNNDVGWLIVDHNHSLAAALAALRKHSNRADCPMKVGTDTVDLIEDMYNKFKRIQVTVNVWQESVQRVVQHFNHLKKAREQLFCANFNSSVLMVLLLHCGALGDYGAVPFYLMTSGDRLTFQDLVQAKMSGDWNALPSQIMAWAYQTQDVKGTKALGPFDASTAKKKKAKSDTDVRDERVLDSYPVVGLRGNEVHVVTNTEVHGVKITSPYKDITVEQMIANSCPALAKALDDLYSKSLIWANQYYKKLTDPEVVEVAKFHVDQAVISVLKSGTWDPQCSTETVATIVDNAMCHVAKRVLKLDSPPHFITDLSGPEQTMVTKEFRLDFQSLVISVAQVFNALLDEGFNPMTSFGLAPVVVEVMRHACPERNLWTKEVMDFIMHLLLLAKMNLSKAQESALGENIAKARQAFCKLKPSLFHNFRQNISNPWYAEMVEENAAPVVRTYSRNKEFMTSVKNVYIGLKPKKVRGDPNVME